MKRREDGVGYQLGVDIGTTHTAAAILRGGRAEMATLGGQSAAIPSVVFLDADGTVVVGDAASQRGFADPTRVARAFKRQLGDPAPIVLGGIPNSGSELMAKLLRRVVDIVSEREGAAPDLVTVSHPASWGPYRTEVVNQVIGLAGLESFRMVSDPEAAAIFHASVEGTAEDDIVVVYDLGGGTFDVAVARRTTDGFETLGTPDGIARLGGIDFDEAVLAHISGAVGVDTEDLDTDDPPTAAAVARLREECAAVKEALSTATEVAVPVFLPGGESEVRLTREDLEAMVRPSLDQTIEVLRATLDAADVEAADIDAVVLVGDSSRIPLVARLVSEELGRPVTVAAEPKHAVALGAALSMVSWAEEHAPDSTLEGGPATAPHVIAETEADPPTATDTPTMIAPEADSAVEPTPDRPAPPPMSVLMSVAAVAVALAMVAAAVAAGTLIALGQVGAGIGLAVGGAAAGVALLLIMRRPSPATSAARE